MFLEGFFKIRAHSGSPGRRPKPTGTVPLLDPLPADIAAGCGPLSGPCDSEPLSLGPRPCTRGLRCHANLKAHVASESYQLRLTLQAARLDPRHAEEGPISRSGGPPEVCIPRPRAEIPTLGTPRSPSRPWSFPGAIIGPPDQAPPDPSVGNLNLKGPGPIWPVLGELPLLTERPRPTSRSLLSSGEILYLYAHTPRATSLEIHGHPHRVTSLEIQFGSCIPRINLINGRAH